MKKLITVVLVLAFLALIGLFVAGYFLGNIPIVSNLMGTNKSVDLGVNISVGGAQQGLKDLALPVTYKDLESLTKNPQSFRTLKTSLTQEEVSSLLALGDIPDFPLKLTQFRFNPDGTVESSGVLDTAVLKTFLGKNGVGSDTIDQINNYLKVDGKVNYYAKGTCSISNNQVNLNLSSVQIGKIPVPDDLLKQSGAAADFASASLTRNGINVRRLAVANGKVELDADRPLSTLKPWLKFVSP